MFAVDKPKFCACLISGKCNFVRCIELILSAFCLTFAILLYSTPLHMVTKIILLAVSSAFWLITFFDVVSWWIWHRIGPKTWIMFAITAFFTFWLCGGFLLFLRGKGNNWLAIMECVLTVITGFIYLFDYIWVTMTAWDSSTKIGPTGTFIDKSVSSCFLFEVNEYECPILKTRARRYPTTVKALKNPSMSHGGTFHVSKEFAPLSSASKDPCHCPKKSSRSTSTSPGRRKNEEHSHNCHRSRSPESEEKSRKRVSIEASGDSIQDIYKLPSFKNRLEEKHNMYYVSTERDQVRASQSLDTVPEKESKSSMDSKNALESKENIRSVEDEKLEPKSKHSIQKNMEDEQELKSFTIVPSKESFRLSTKNLVNVNDEHDENSSKHILTSHRTDESTHDTESPSEEKQQKKSRESIISSMVKLFSRSKQDTREVKIDLEKKLSTLQEDSNENTSIKMQDSRAALCQQSSATQDAVHHQYYQSPCCKCGRTHYQQQTTVTGSLMRCCNPNCPGIQNHEPPQRLPRQTSALNRSESSVRNQMIEPPLKLTKCTMACITKNASTDTPRTLSCRDNTTQKLASSRRLLYQSTGSLQRTPTVRDQSCGSREPVPISSLSLKANREMYGEPGPMSTQSMRNNRDVVSGNPNFSSSLLARSQQNQDFYCGCRRNGLDADYNSRPQFSQISQRSGINTSSNLCQEMGTEMSLPAKECSVADSLERREISSSVTPDSVDEEIMVCPISETKEVNAIDKNLWPNVCTCCTCNDVRIFCGNCCEPCKEPIMPDQMDFVTLSRESKTSQISGSIIPNCHADPICSLCKLDKLTVDKSVNTLPKKKRFCFGKKH